MDTPGQHAELIAEQDLAPWASSPHEVMSAMESEERGLATTEAERRLEEHGPNRLAPPERDPLWRRILSHFDDVLIYILLVAAALKAILGDWVDFSVILAVAVINAAIGFIQEGRAEKALDGIRHMLSPTAQVRRDGAWSDVDAADLVPGDVVRVGAGARVPADVRLLEARSLNVEESALTGESVSAEKSVAAVDAEAGLGDRTSMLFSGTLVAAGQGTGVVTATGQATEIGRIQTMIAEVESLETPLTRELGRLGKVIAVAIAVIALVMAVVGRTVHDIALPDLISAAIGVAVAAVPEGLPALVTITLALGVQQMARRHAITRKLPAVETLGAVTTICSDKTGTLTKNEMTARVVRTASATFAVEGSGYAPVGDIAPEGGGEGDAPDAALEGVVAVAIACNDAQIQHDEARGWQLVGEPTEGALHSLARKAGQDPEHWKRLDALPFSSETKYMATLDEDREGHTHIHVKGAPDRILARCATQIGADGDAVPLETERWEEWIEELSARGLRVLATARATAPAGTTELAAEDVESGLELCGIVGIVDPPRPEAIEAIAQCRQAGIRVKMITGDHAGTALAIAREMGIVTDERQQDGETAQAEAPAVLTGTELEAMSTEQLRAVVRDVDVFARTSPEHKLRIVSALQAHGEVAAMTGDGVNDAPALAQANVGVAMGIKGTEATKEAAEIVLADDNFTTIERAVEEGRRIYDNIRKSVLFLLPTSGAQALVILVAVFLGLQLPLAPVQVLWINLITAVTLSLALAYEPAEPDIMHRSPRPVTSGILTAHYVVRIAIVSMLIGGITLVAFYSLVGAGTPTAQAETTAVTLLAFAQLAYLFSCRYLDKSSLTPKVFRGNRVIWISAGALLVLQSVFVYAPFMNLWFGSAPITPAQWGLVVGLSLVVFLLTELGKAAQPRIAALVRRG